MFGPNIIGNAGSWPAWTTTTGSEAMIIYQSSDSAHVSGGNGTMVAVSFGFNAGLANSTYGNGIKVRPESGLLYACIKA